MKIVFRTLIILAAALVVASGLYAFRQSSLGQSLTSSSSGAGAEHSGPPPGVTAGAEGSGGHSAESGGLNMMGLAAAGKTLGITAVCIVLVALGERLVRLARRDRTRAAPPTPL